MTEKPTHAEREVQRARADLSETLDALKEKLSFGELFEEASSRFMSGDGAQFIRNLARQARENPMPAVLAGASLLWMMLGKQRERRPTHERQPTYGMGNGPGMRTAAESAQETGEGTLERARSAVSSAGGAVRSAAETVGDVMGSVGHTVGHTMSSAKEAARSATGTAAGLMHSVRETAQSAAEGAQHMRQRTTRSFSEIVEQQPLVLGAIGLALGALVGAMLPRTRMEDEYLGEARDQLRETISEQSGQLYERGRVTATEVYRAAAEEARAQGLLPEGGGGQTLVEKAEEVIAKAGEKAREVAERELGGDEPAGSRGDESRIAQGTPGGTREQTASPETTGTKAPETIRPGQPVMPDRGR